MAVRASFFFRQSSAKFLIFRWGILRKAVEQIGQSQTPAQKKRQNTQYFFAAEAFPSLAAVHSKISVISNPSPHILNFQIGDPKMNYNMKQSGNRIRQLRRESGYTQEELAEKLNMDRSILSRVEAGKYACSVDFLAQISSLFNVSLDYLVFGKIQDRDVAQLKKSLAEIIQCLECFNEQL